MPVLRSLAHVILPGDAALSRVTGLMVRARDDGTGLVYATNRHDGAVTVWALTASGLARIDSAAYQRPGGAGGAPGIAFADLPAGAGLIAGGGVSGGFTLHPVAADGTLGAAQALGAPPGLTGDLTDMEMVTTATGWRLIYGGMTGVAGIARMVISPQGAITQVFRTGDTPTTHAERVTALAQARVGDDLFLLGASAVNPGLTLYQVGNTGSLTARASVSAAQGLWVATPTALETVTLGGRVYAVLAAAESDSLTVVEIGAGGSLTPRAHVIDDLDSRFGGVTAIAVVTHQGLVHVVAGGADDGISVFVLLPGGQLVGQAHLADSPGSGLSNIAAITAQARGDGIDIIVASSREAGLTRLRFDTGPAGASLTAAPGGATLAGTAGRDLIRGGTGADSLAGGAGDDLILDGAGADRLAGGPGADLFILSADRGPDLISDFTPGTDRLNLTAWPGLRSAGQLTFTALPNGLRITYGDEVLTLISADGRPISPGQLPAADLIGGANYPVIAEPGLPGPPRPDPPLPPKLSDDPPPDPLPPDPPDPLPETGGKPPVGVPWAGLTGTPGPDSLRGTGGGDVMAGLASADLIRGLGGADRIRGDGGDDSLYGETGADRLRGGAGADALYGGAGDDGLRGQRGDDTLQGGAGRDRLSGGPGADRLDGGAGRDRLAGGAGADLLWGLGGGDSLAGGPGSDRLAGGAGSDRLAGDSGKDALSGGAGADRLAGGADRDRLAGEGGRDRLAGGAGPDLFVFAAGAGADRITDFGRGGDALVLDPDLWGGGRLSAERIVARFADRVGGDILLDFGQGDRITLDGFSRLAILSDHILLG